MTGESGRDITSGQFLPGNRLWEARSTAGPKPRFATPEPLWAACCEYFAWVEDNPLIEVKGFAFQGVVTKETFPKMRAMTIGGLCIFLDISEVTWHEWQKSRPDLANVIDQVEAIIYQQKFTGAAADLLNANIISRELGLADRKEVTGANGGAIETKDVSISETARKLAFILSQAIKENPDG